VGRKGGELACVKDALRIVKSLLGTTPAAEFGPKKLKSVRQAMLDKGWCRTNVNHQIDRVRRSFPWAVSEEMLPGDIYHALQSLPALRRGMPGVRESEPVRPAPVDLINAALPLMPAPVGAMVEIQLLSGCRPSEACAMGPATST
jgi:integrase